MGLFCILTLVLLYDFYVEKHLAADGVSYFVYILEFKTFSIPIKYRFFADVITQAPLVLAVQMGVKSLGMLVPIFALGILLPYFLSFALCLVALRGQSLVLLLFPLLSVTLVLFPSDYLLFGEHQVMALFAWPLLFFALRPQAPTLREGALLFALVFGFAHTYETSLIPSLLLAALFAGRFLRAAPGSKGRWILLSAALLCIYSVVMATLSVLNTNLPHHRTGFIESLAVPYRNPIMIVSLLFAMAWFAWAWTKKGYLLRLSIGFLALIGLLALTGATDPSCFLSLSSRTLTATLLPLLLWAATIVSSERITLNGQGLATISCFILLASGITIHNSGAWGEYREQVKATLQQGTGFIPLEDTPFRYSDIDEDWNYPLLSVVWSSPCVRTIIEKGKDAVFNPFDIRRQLFLADYVQFNVPDRHTPIVTGCDP